MMGGVHPTAEELERYRRRTAEPRALLAVDAHLATCERCFETVRAKNATVAIPRDDAHLTFEELAAYVDGSADAIDREAAQAHLAGCTTCRGEVDDLAQVRDAIAVGSRAERRGSWQWLAAAAVLIALILGGGWWFSRDARDGGPAVVQAAPSSTEVPAPRVAALVRPDVLTTLDGGAYVLRGPDDEKVFALRAPVGTVVLDDRPQFRWDAAEGATAYDIAIADAENGEIVATGSSPSPSWRPVAPLPRERTYTWQVTARVAGEDVVSPRADDAEALFRVASLQVVESLHGISDARARGIALANHGVLDGAEQELARSGAYGLLAEVRAWRAHGAPTTTNGAQ